MALEQLPMLPGQTTLVERVRYQLAVGTPFVFVTGESGFGKTVISEKICSAVDNDYLCAFVPCSKALTIQKLRELLLQQLSPTTVFNADDKLIGTVQRINFATKKVIIVVDNIDEAQESFLIELAEIYQTYKAQELFNIILTSTPAWADARVRSLKEIGISPIEIEIPFLSNQDKLNEIEYYLRLYGVKVSDKDLISIKGIEKKCSPEDVRRLAQNLADKNKEIKMTEDKKQEETASSKTPTNATKSNTSKKNSKVSLILTTSAVIAAAVVLAVVWYQQSYKSSFSLTPKENNAPVSNTKVTDDLAQAIAKDEDFIKDEDDASTNGLPETVAENTIVVDNSEEAKNQIVVSDEQIIEIENKEVTKDKSEEASVAKNEVSNMDPLAEKKSEVTVATSSEPSAPAVNDKTKQESTEVAKTDKKVIEATKSTVEPEPAKSTTAEGNGTLRSDFAELNDNHYTVQLMATKSEADAKQLAKKISGDLWILFRNKDKHYILMWGDFASSKDASKAIATLPKNIRSQGPWSKKIGKVKQEIK